MNASLYVTRGVHRCTGYYNRRLDMTSLPMRIEQVLYRVYCVVYTVFVYGHIQSVGVTAYCIYNNVHIVKLKRWVTTYINREIILFPSGHLEACSFQMH